MLSKGKPEDIAKFLQRVEDRYDKTMSDLCAIHIQGIPEDIFFDPDILFGGQVILEENVSD